MNYTFHQLQVFVQVARLGSITRAAEVMNMTQPALSIQLRNFQNQFNQPLTEVVGRKIYITDFGKAIAELADNVLREADALRFKTKEYEGLLAGRLKIASASTGKFVIPYFLSGFHQLHKSIDLELDVTSRKNVLEQLKANAIDFALVSVLPDKLPVEEEKLLDNYLYLVGSADYYEETQSLLYREEGSATRAAMDKYFHAQGQRKEIALTSNEAVKQAVIAGLGYSILPLVSMKNELMSKELHIIPLKGLPLVTSWRLIWLKDKKLSRVAEAFLNYVRQKKKIIIQEKFNWIEVFQQEL